MRRLTSWPTGRRWNQFPQTPARRPAALAFVPLESRDTPGSMLDSLLADALRLAPLATPVAEPQFFHPLAATAARPPAFVEDFSADPFMPREAPPAKVQPTPPSAGRGEDTSARRTMPLDDLLPDWAGPASVAPVRLPVPPAPALRGEPPAGEPAWSAPTPAARGAAAPAGGMSETAEASDPPSAFPSLSVAGADPTGGTVKTGATSAMVVELPLVSVTAYDPAAAELRGPPGSTTGVFEFDRTGDTAADLTVKFRVDGTATPDADYTGLGTLTTEAIDGEAVLTGTAVIPAGQSWVRVMVTAVDDTLVEGDEDARLTVLGTAEYNPDPDRPEATVAIADNDPMGDPSQQVWVERVDPTAQKDYENPTDPQNVGKVELRRSLASGLLNVNYSVSGTAALNTDYSLWGPVASGYYNQITDTKLAATGKVTFADGQDSIWVRFVPVGSGGPADLTADLTVTAGTGYAVADPHEGDVGVYGDRAPGWAVQPNPNGGYAGELLDVWVTTGQEMTYAGYGPYTGDATAAEAGQDPGSILVTYQYQTDDPGFVPPDPPSQAWVVGGTADWDDYTMTVTRVVAARTDDAIYFPTTGKTVYRISSVDRIDIVPVDDGAWEGDETVDVAVGRAWDDTGGVIGDAQVTITDDASASLPAVSVGAPDGVSAEWGPSTGSYRLTRADSKLAFPLAVSYQFGGTATYGVDYTVTGKDPTTGLQVTLPQAGTVTFPAGVSAIEVKLTPIDDTAEEGPETVTLTLLEAPDYQVLTPPSADVRIRDDDATASVGGLVWEDFNEDGTQIQDPAEEGLDNVEVRLYAGSTPGAGILIDTTATNSAGFYRFQSLLPGTYYVGFEMVGDASPADVGDDATDSDVTTVGNDEFGYTAAFNLAAREEKDSVDSGLEPVAAEEENDSVEVDPNPAAKEIAGKGTAKFSVEALDGQPEVRVTDVNGAPLAIVSTPARRGETELFGIGLQAWDPATRTATLAGGRQFKVSQENMKPGYRFGARSLGAFIEAGQENANPPPPSTKFYWAQYARGDIDQSVLGGNAAMFGTEGPPRDGKWHVDGKADGISGLKDSYKTQTMTAHHPYSDAPGVTWTAAWLPRQNLPNPEVRQVRGQWVVLWRVASKDDVVARLVQQAKRAVNNRSWFHNPRAAGPAVPNPGKTWVR